MRATRSQGWQQQGQKGPTQSGATEVTSDVCHAGCLSAFLMMCFVNALNLKLPA